MPAAAGEPPEFPLPPPGPFTTAFRLTTVPRHSRTAHVKGAIVTAVGGLWGPMAASAPSTGEAGGQKTYIEIVCVQCVGRNGRKIFRGTEASAEVLTPQATVELEVSDSENISTTVDPRSRISVGASRYGAVSRSGHHVELFADREKVYALRASGHSRLQLTLISESCDATAVPESLGSGSEPVYDLPETARPCPSVWEPAEGII